MRYQANSSKVLLLTVVMLNVTAAPGIGQIDIQGDGSTVRLGPNGIDIRSSSGETVRLTPGRITTGRSSAAPRKANTSTVTVRKYRAAGAAGGSVALGVPARVLKLETSVFGKTFPGRPLIQRVDALDMNIFGHKNEGTLASRVQRLSESLESADAEVTSQSRQSIQINTTSAGSTTAILPGMIVAGGTVTLNDDGVNGTVSGDNSACTINGDRCNLVLSGSCAMLVINGNNNTVTANRVGTVVFNGASNHLKWKQGLNSAQPFVTDNSKGNSIQKQL